MPYTNTNTGEESGRYRFHLWLKHPNPTWSVTEGKDRIKALCGQVHVFGEDELREIREEVDTLPMGDGEHATLPAFLRRNDVCVTCADVAREELGLPERDLEDVSGVGSTKATALREAGFTSVADLRRASQEELATTATSGHIGNALAARIKAEVGNEEDVVRP